MAGKLNTEGVCLVGSWVDKEWVFYKSKDL